MPAKSERQRRFFYLVKGVQKGKISPKKVDSKITKAARSISSKDVDDFTHGKNLPKKKLQEIIECLKQCNKDPFTNLDAGFVNQNTGMSPLEPMALETSLDDPSNTEEQNPIAKTFKQQGNFDEYVGKFSGLELKPKEIESVTNYTNAKPTKMDQFSIRYESTDEFSNNTITVIKKLREGNDLVFTIFQSSTQQSGTTEEPAKPEETGENQIIVNKSRSFTDEIEGGKVLSDLLQKLEI